MEVLCNHLFILSLVIHLFKLSLVFFHLVKLSLVFSLVYVDITAHLRLKLDSNYV